MSRKLASIQKIEKINPILGADNIEEVKVLGWNLVAKKNEFKVNSLCVYFEIDSILPKDKEWAAFLSSKNFRVKTIKLKGVLSQGLALPLTILGGNKEYQIGDDVSEELGVIKYEPLIDTSGGKMLGQSKGNFPSHLIDKTDETRIQSIQSVLEELKNQPYFITSKCDGTSATYLYDEEEFCCCSRNLKKAEDEVNVYWRMAKKYNLKEVLNHPNRYAIQGEIAGPGCPAGSKVLYGLPEIDLFVFNVFDIVSGQYLSYLDFINFCKDRNLRTVPILEVGDKFNYTLEELIEKARGKYIEFNLNTNREGIVIRPQTEMYSEVLHGRLSFKVINNDYLLKNEI